MLGIVRYKASVKPCYLAPNKRHVRSQYPDAIPCKGTHRIFPDWIFTGNRTVLCEAHARSYYGDARIDQLIRMGSIRAWKVSEENATRKGALWT
jgi:hypothetical protein